MQYCYHPNLIQTARNDCCPDCGYNYYYGDAHAKGSAQISKLVNPGRDAKANGEEEPYDYANYGVD